MDKYKKYKNFIDFQWWTGIEKRNVDAWLGNFQKDKKWIGRLILDNIIFYSSTQLDSYTLYIINQMRSELYQDEQHRCSSVSRDDAYYFECWDKYKKKLKIMPAAMSGDVGASAYQVVRRYRQFLGNESVSDKDSIGQWIKSGIEKFIFVDDFSGSGSQIKEFLESEIQVEKEKVKICNLTERFPQIEISVALYVIHDEAIRFLKKRFPNIKIRFVDFIDNKMNFLNFESVFYKHRTLEEKKEAIDYIEQQKKMIMAEKIKYYEMSKYQLNIPIIFYHGCPNNSLMLLFANTRNWKQIFYLGEDNGTF